MPGYDRGRTSRTCAAYRRGRVRNGRAGAPGQTQHPWTIADRRPRSKHIFGVGYDRGRGQVSPGKSTYHPQVDRQGGLEARAEGEGVRRKWYVSVDSLHALRMSQLGEGGSPRTVREEDLGDSLADVIRDMSARLEDRTAEAVEMRTRFELTERTRSTMEEEAARLREENERLRFELEAERSKGFWRRLFRG
jgi:hypothetical protein